VVFRGAKGFFANERRVKEMSPRGKVIGVGKAKVLYALMVVVVGVVCWCAAGEAATINVDCAAGESITTTFHGASPGDTIVVSGTCNETVYIGSSPAYVTIDGQGSATIQTPDPQKPGVIASMSDNVTIKGFTITGASVSPAVGIAVVGGSVRIDGNHISNNHMGILVRDSGSAAIINNTIEQNARLGILIHSISFARIGIVFPFDTSAQANLIQNNGQGATSSEIPGGVAVIGSSSAQIIGNKIIDNTGDGITVDGVSQVECAHNDISGNRNGIFVSRNSSVRLTRDPTGSTIFDIPNTSTVKNHSWGIYCSIGACVDGRIGTLSGLRSLGIRSLGPVYATSGCIDQTTP
jgi:nitrous oxidase accessory protein